MRWLAEHHEVISTLTGAGTLLIWLVYLQVFISNYRRQLRPKILIARGAGTGLDARCLVSNMSSGPAFVQSIIVTLEVDGERWLCPVTDLLDLEEEEAPSEPAQRTRQGPLLTGDLKDMGSFRSLVRHVLRGRHGRSADLDAEFCRKLTAIDIEVLGVYGSEDVPIGAKRTFRVLWKADGLVLRGATLSTEQIRNRRDRKKLMADLKYDP